MSYHVDLDEYTELQLLDELERRKKVRKRGLCDYCGMPRKTTASCKFPERHNLENR